MPSVLILRIIYLKLSLVNMLDYLNYLSHITINPSYYQRRFDYDLPQIDEKWIKVGKRTLLIALPFLSLYKPAGQGISIAMGSTRCFSHLIEAGKLGDQKEALECAKQVVLTGLAVAELVASFFQFQVGLLVTTTADMGMSLARAVEHIRNEKYDLAIEELLQTTSSTLYLFMLIEGSLEITLASLLLQAVMNLNQARQEWQKGRKPECLAKLIMGMVRCYQGHQYVQLIQRRNFFLSMNKFKKLLEQIQKGREASHLINSPLNEEKEVILVDAQGNPYNFGSHFHGYGKEVVKGMNLQFRTFVVDGQNRKEIEFKVNHVFRDHLEILIKEMSQFKSSELKEFLALTHSHAKDIKIEEVPFNLATKIDKSIGSAYRITLEGLGSVTIGNSKDYSNLYDRVRIEIDETKTLYECHELLSFFNLDLALQTSTPEDIERLKIGHLFRIFCPEEAILLERRKFFFNVPIDKLKEEMIRQSPEMKIVLEKYLPTMQESEILPGRVRYSIPELSKIVYDLGGRGLISTLTGPDNEIYSRLASIFKMGMLATEVRYSNKINFSGLSSKADFYMGGTDSVYGQFLTKKNVEERMSFSNLYWGKVRILFSLDVLNTGTYQYHQDSYGTRRLSSLYLNRPNIFDFVKDEQIQFGIGNEVMVKERIAPSMITGVIVPDEHARNQLLATLRTSGMVGLTKEGNETILDIPIDRFIHVGNHLSESMFT